VSESQKTQIVEKLGIEVAYKLRTTKKEPKDDFIDNRIKEEL
jgi:hypothetical protein